MERDATLEDFLAGDETDPPDDESGESPEGASDQSDETPEVKQATSTMSYRPGGGACAVCGTVVERRWHEADGLVCRDCKDW